MAGKKRKEWLKKKVGAFVKSYTRQAQRGVEPNDRKYDRDVERHLKNLSAEELNELLYDEEKN